MGNLVTVGLLFCATILFAVMAPGALDADDMGFRLGALLLFGSAVGLTGRVRLVHGELSQSEALAKTLGGMGFADVGVPGREEVVSVA